jgi:hypothetical protein
MKHKWMLFLIILVLVDSGGDIGSDCIIQR